MTVTHRPVAMFHRSLDVVRLMLLTWFTPHMGPSFSVKQFKFRLICPKNSFSKLERLIRMLLSKFEPFCVVSLTDEGSFLGQFTIVPPFYDAAANRSIGNI